MLGSNTLFTINTSSSQLTPHMSTPATTAATAASTVIKRVPRMGGGFGLKSGERSEGDGEATHIHESTCMEKGKSANGGAKR